MPLRKCFICLKEDNLVGRIRSKTCLNCSLKLNPRRYQTGRNKDGWSINKTNGYLERRRNNKLEYQHRKVMEEYLGRKLFKYE